MSLIDALNIAALVLAPVVAVFIGQCLQNRAEGRKDKMLVFKTLMTYRVFGWSRESVDAMNIIEVVFADDKGVREAWKSLYDKLNVSHIDQQQLSKIEMAKFRLLEEMAKALGYKNKITWETIQNPYVPVGLLKQMQSQEEYSQGMISALGQLNSMLSKTPEDVTIREDASDG